MPRRVPGEAVQVDPIKPTLKAPGTKRLKLKWDDPLSSFGFNFNLRHYSLGSGSVAARMSRFETASIWVGSRNGAAVGMLHEFP